MFMAALCLVLATPFGQATGPADPVLFEFEGRDYRMVDLPPKLRKLLSRQQVRHYREQRELYEELAFDAFLNSEARRTGTPRTTLAKDLLAVPEPTEAEARKFYDANKSRIAQDFATVRHRIVRTLVSDQLAEKKRAIVAALERRGRVKLPSTRPLPPAVDLAIEAFPSIGPSDAAITVVEFADFSCSLCRGVSGVMHELLAEHPHTLRWVFVHFPVAKKGVGRHIHAGGQCLMEQQLFWAYHDLVFERMVDINAQDAPQLAAEVGADMTRFDACYAGKTGEWAVRRGLELGRKHRVTRTPTLFVNGRPFASSQLKKDLGALIENSTTGL